MTSTASRVRHILTLLLVTFSLTVSFIALFSVQAFVSPCSQHPSSLTPCAYRWWRGTPSAAAYTTSMLSIHVRQGHKGDTLFKRRLFSSATPATNIQEVVRHHKVTYRDRISRIPVTSVVDGTTHIRNDAWKPVRKHQDLWSRQSSFHRGVRDHVITARTRHDATRPMLETTLISPKLGQHSTSTPASRTYDIETEEDTR